MRFAEIDLTDVKGVLLDLDNTVYPFTPSHETALKACFEAFPCTLSWEDFVVLLDEHKDGVIARLSPQGTCRTRYFWFESLFLSLNIAKPHLLASVLHDTYWKTFMNSMKASHDALHFLERCRSSAIPVCIVTDMTIRIQIEKIRILGLDDLVSFVVSSEEVGAEKPDPRMFHTSLRKLGLKAEDCIMIGDNLEKDIDGAIACGIRAFHID